MKILDGPSAIEPMTKLEEKLFADYPDLLPLPGEGSSKTRLWVKRDDRSWDALGGNKARKLEFLLGEAKQRGVHNLVTSGNFGSNHCFATAVAGKRYGFGVTLDVGPQPITPDVKKKLLAFHALGAKLNYNGGQAGLAINIATSYLSSRVDHDTLYIPTGGSNALGALGYVNAFLELAQQVGMQGLPDQIVVPAGTGGTSNGLLVGSCLAGAFEKTKIVGVGVQMPLLTNERQVRRDAERTYNFIAAHLSPEERARLPHCDFRHSTKAFGFTSDYYPPEYGAATPPVIDGIDLLRDIEGIQLDDTYSGKAMRYYLDQVLGHLAHHEAVPKMLFWLTYDSYDLDKIIDAYPWKDPTQPWKELPEDFWRIYQ